MNQVMGREERGGAGERGSEGWLRSAKTTATKIAQRKANKKSKQTKTASSIHPSYVHHHCHHINNIWWHSHDNDWWSYCCIIIIIINTTAGVHQSSDEWYVAVIVMKLTHLWPPLFLFFNY
jgi:hypothetical protein